MAMTPSQPSRSSAMKGTRFVRAERVELPNPYTGERTLPYLLLQTSF